MKICYRFQIGDRVIYTPERFIVGTIVGLTQKEDNSFWYRIIWDEYDYNLVGNESEESLELLTKKETILCKTK